MVCVRAYMCVWIVRMDGVHLLRICTFNIPLKGLQTSVYQTELPNI